MDTTVWCRQCLRSQPVEYGTAILQGWPLCCGDTMRIASLPSAQEIHAAVGKALAPLLSVRLAAARLRARGL